MYRHSSNNLELGLGIMRMNKDMRMILKKPLQLMAKITRIRAGAGEFLLLTKTET